MAVSSSSGVATIYAYSPSGEPAGGWGSTAATPIFRYTGQAALPQIGLYYYKARMYDPVLGRFLQTDPIGYKDEWNLYAYVGNDPVNKADPSGNCIDACVAEGIGGGTIVIIAAAGVLSGACAFTECLTKAYDNLKNDINSLVHRNDNTDKPTAANDNNNPRPGRKGGPDHQEKVKDRIKELEDQGHTHVAGGDKKEETVQTPGGSKGSRSPDITTTDPNGKPYRENVGLENKNGTPVSREQKAIQDIKDATGQCGFTSYGCRN